MPLTSTELLASLKIAGWIDDHLPAASEIREGIDEIRNPLPEGIKGCLHHDGVLWRFRATFDIDNRAVEDVDLRSYPICPNCRNELNSETDDLFGSGRKSITGSSAFDERRKREMSNRPLWECPNCGFGVSRERRVRSDVETFAHRHAERIVETPNEAYSLPALVSELDEVDGRSIWEQYAAVVNEDQVSTECFH